MPVEAAKLFAFDRLFEDLTAEGFGDWAATLKRETAAALSSDGHGSLTTWIDAWNKLPDIAADSIRLDQGAVEATGIITDDERAILRTTLQQFHPWRKGPFRLFDIDIDTEWRSDWKWNRLQNHVELRDRRILDVGCGNGYFGWRMLAAGASLVLGLDPFLLYVMQHEVLRRCLGQALPNYVLPATDAVIPTRLNAFDVTFSMGVLYHRTSPIDHLKTLHDSLKTGGQLVLETLIVEGEARHVLVPEGRYAKMRNVWFLPTVPMLELWLRRTKFTDIRLVDITVTSTDEQRSTDWMTFESLPDFLDPADDNKSIEGYPAPVRAILTAKAM